MTRLKRAFGVPLAAIILLFSGLWMVGLIAVPQALMVDQSLWRMERPEGLVDVSLEIDGLYNRLDVLKLDAAEADKQPDLDLRTERLNEITAEEELITAKIGELEAKESKPVRVYTLENYNQMSAAHLAIFLKTILASLAVTTIALIVCYPIAYALTKGEARRRASLIILALIIPYAIAELLRVFAWQMILNTNGPINAFLGHFGIGPLPFLESGVGVFIAMVYAYILFMVFPLYNVLATLDTNQIEAARDLNAPVWQIHRRVVIPHARPGIAAGSIMTFMLSAGSYTVPYIMTRGTAAPWFTQVIYNRFFETTNWNIGAAYAVSLLAACLVFIFLIMRLLKVRLEDIAK